MNIKKYLKPPPRKSIAGIILNSTFPCSWRGPVVNGLVMLNGDHDITLPNPNNSRFKRGSHSKCLHILAITFDLSKIWVIQSPFWKRKLILFWVRSIELLEHNYCLYFTSRDSNFPSPKLDLRRSPKKDLYWGTTSWFLDIQYTLTDGYTPLKW